MTAVEGAVEAAGQATNAAAAKRILVADDELDIRTLISTVLGRAGFEVTQVGDGPAALAAAEASPPDLIVLDLMMPGIPGLDVCRKLHTAPRTSHVPVILLTAVANPSYVAIGYDAGAVHYMTKPFSPAALVNRIRTVLRNR